MDLIITKSRGSAVQIIFYKPIGLKWNKQKAVTVAGLQAFLHLELHLHRQHLSVARASRLQSYHPSVLASNSWSDPASCQTIPKDGIGSRHHPYASFKWMQRYKKLPRIGWGFLCKHKYLYISTHIHNHVTHPSQVGAGTPSPCTLADSTGGSGLEGGRKLGLLL